MWLPRLIELLETHERPVALTGGEDFGVPFLIEALRARTPLAWFEIGPRAAGDAVALGNALARAVNATLPTPLLGMALPYRTQLSALRLYRSELQPLCLAVTTDQPNEALLSELLDLTHEGYSVVLDLRGGRPTPEALLERCVSIGEDQLRVRLDEAIDILPRVFSEAEAEALWREADGRFTQLFAAAASASGLPQPTLPSPTGEQVLEQEAELVEPALVVQALKREGDLVGALELAVMAAPEMVDGLLRQAGPRYQEEGLLERLHLLLAALPDEYSNTERVLEWRLVAAFAANDRAAVLPDVDAYLAVHSAPALRARRAGIMPREAGFEMARQAVESQRSALTLWQLGRLHPDHATGAQLLREAVDLAEERGSRYDVVRNAGALVARLNHAGEYGEAASWARWTLDLFDQGEVVEGNRRLQVINDLAVARILSGDLVGMRRPLEDAQALSEGSLPQHAALLRGTLAWLELAEQRPSAALELLRANYLASPRKSRTRRGCELVRGLLEVGRLDEAARVAADITELSAVGVEAERSLAALARGMVGAVTGAPEAPDDLQTALHDTSLVAEQRLMAALYFLLAVDGGASRLPPDLARLLSQLHPTALRVLSGPEALLAPVWATLHKRSAALTLRFLAGEVTAVHGGREVKLPQRVAEVALALALHPEGITRDALNDFLTPEGQAPFTAGGMRGMLTRVRTLLPVSDAPYRLTVPYVADVAELREHLANHRVRQAVALYRQPLLPLSEAPGVVEEREGLEEELRQAVLLSRDADALCELAERLGDDLETWEAAAAVLGPSDPRLAVARARVKRLEASYAEGAPAAV